MEPSKAHESAPGGGGLQPQPTSAEALRAAREALAGLPEPVVTTLRGLVNRALEDHLEIITERDVVMIVGEHWNGCLVHVQEVRGWGIQGFVRIPTQGDAYIRVPNGDFVRVGRVPDDIHEVSDPGGL